MNIGIIYCGYNQLDNIKESLQFWNNIVLDNVTFNIAVVSVPFVEYVDMNVIEDGSLKFISEIKNNNIKYKIFDPKFVKEGVARSVGLKNLLNLEIDVVWQVDSDEFYTKKDVENICNFIKDNNHPAYSVNFKNYIFDGNHYIDKYCTVRIYRVYKDDKFLGFLDDCNMIYENKKFINPLEIPKDLAWIKHMTWLHSNGKEKVEYQLKHFGYCGFKWNSINQKLELNEDYFCQNGYPLPKIIKESV